MQQATMDEQKDLVRNNLPLPVGDRPWSQRFLRSKWTWIVLVVLGIEAAALIHTGMMVIPDREVPGGTTIGTGVEALGLSTRYALITVVPLSLLFLWSDRFRPQRFWVWLITFGWGGSVAVWASLQLNSWAAEHLSIVGPGDPATGARAATFVAPFVEESMKAIILFLIAMVFRYRIVSKLSGVALAGLVGASFAFVENIVYYARRYRAAAQTTGAASPDDAVRELFFMRGVFTFFGHPLFTAMTGIGLAVALRSKSKLVRVLAPVTGFLVAALLHMVFNGLASAIPDETTFKVTIALMAYPMVLALIIFVIRQLFAEKRLINARLTDYARMGWLPPTDAHWVSRLTTRVRVLWQALWEGRPLTTYRLQRALTELAYLRDSMARGLVDAGGMAREKELFAIIRRLRPNGIVEPRQRTNYPWSRPTADPVWAPPSHTGSLGLGGHYPAPVTSLPQAPAISAGLPLGSGETTYSPVDPRWKPPGS